MTANLSAHAAPTRPWAEVDVERLGCLRGDLIAFDQRVAVVALHRRADVPPGRAVWVLLGIDGEQAERVAGAVIDCFDDRGRRCVSIELADLVGAGKRRHPRVPFEERIEVIGITDRPGPDPRWRGMAFDLSIQGLGATLRSEIRGGALVLLRFVLPPHRAVFQVRAIAKNCSREASEAFRTGFLFERVTAGHADQLRAAMFHLARQRDVRA